MRETGRGALPDQVESFDRPQPAPVDAGAATDGGIVPLNGELSPYRVFTRAEWASLRADTPMTLTVDELVRLQSLNDQLSLSEVAEIYLPLSRLLSLYVAAMQGLFRATERFLAVEDGKVPYIIGIAGSVAAGKSTTARVLEALLARWPNTPKVQLVTTDGFLFPNAELNRLGIMKRKGFPESYDMQALLRFLSAIKAGARNVRAPVYSHLTYDVVPGEEIAVDRPDILIVEGLNVLQTARPPRDGRAVPFVSDFFDFSIYVDANEELLHQWYVNRFMRLRKTAFRNPQSYFRRHADVPEEEARQTAEELWSGTNLINLRDNILPTRQRASLILRKGDSHRIEEVALRRL
ncbi:type I pantothenate kinase [Pseudochelatococcus lubricantis]